MNIEVRPGKHQPYLLDQKMFVRNGSETVRASNERVKHMILNQELDEFDLYKSTEQNLTFEYIQNVFRKKGMEYKPKALGF